MGTNYVFKDIMRDYDRDRQHAYHLKKRRQEEVFKKIPRIAEIDSQIAEAGIQMTKFILKKEKAEINQLNHFIDNLIEEKNMLLRQAGYPENYFDDIYKCKKCNDTGFIGNQKCTCLNQRLITKYYELSNLSETLERENFDTFDFRYYSEEVLPSEGLSPREKIKLIYNRSLKFASNVGKTFENFLFYGQAGLGKTFLCNCIAKEVLDRGHTVLYITANQLFKTVEDVRFNRDDLEEPSEQMNMFYNVDLLIIDDLGSEFSTIVTQSEFFNIINSRMLDKKSTVISTNLTPKGLQDQYSERIFSRFHGEYELFKFIGEDIREIKKYASF